MGGPGSGRRPRTVERAAQVAGLSRVLLEPVMARAAALGDTVTVDAIGTELANRTWQWHNPYADWLPTVSESPVAPGP